jgi:hypothetical protein
VALQRLAMPALDQSDAVALLGAYDRDGFVVVPEAVDPTAAARAVSIPAPAAANDEACIVNVHPYAQRSARLRPVSWPDASMTLSTTEVPATNRIYQPSSIRGR